MYSLYIHRPALPPHAVDKRFRGRDDSKEVSKKVCHYFGGNGRYDELEDEVYTTESDDLKSLMVPISQVHTAMYDMTLVKLDQ